MNSHPSITPDWKWGTTEGSREFDRIMDRRLSFREKIMWLEEAENLTLALQANRERIRLSKLASPSPTPQPRQSLSAASPASCELTE